MGYRSDVAYTIRFRGQKEDDFFLFLAEAKSKPELKLALDECDIDTVRKRINFNCESTKWYESDLGVQSHMALLDLAEEWTEHPSNGEDIVKNHPLSGCPIGYVFIRIGEDDEDIERRQGGEYELDWVYTSREIITDWL
jgi:hypothetical protein